MVDRNRSRNGDTILACYLVTGGAGFIGSNLVEALAAQGERVRVLDNFATGLRKNLEPFDGKFDLIEGDLRDLEQVRKAVDGVDYVLHQGALGSVSRSVDDPATSNAVNVDGTINVLVAARDAGVKRVVYAASSSAYGDTPTLPKREDMAPQPKSPYAVSKLAGEHYCRAFHNVYGLETVALRYFNVFGPRQNPRVRYAAVIPLFLSALLADEAAVLEGDGGQTRDFTFIADCVRANLLACTAPKAAGETMNIAGGRERSILSVLRLAQEITGKSIEPVQNPPRPGDVRRSLADITKARELLGWEPQVSFEDGLRRTAEWICGGPR